MRNGGKTDILHKSDIWDKTDMGIVAGLNKYAPHKKTYEKRQKFAEKLAPTKVY